MEGSGLVLSLSVHEDPRNEHRQLLDDETKVHRAIGQITLNLLPP